MWRKNLLLALMLVTVATSVLAGLHQTRRLERMLEPVPVPRTEDSTFSRTLERVQQSFQDRWTDRGLDAAPRADELTIARRTALALVGTIPSLEELRAYESLPPAVRGAWWVDRLLADRRHADYLAERLGRAFVGTDQGPFIVYRRRRFVNWLSDQLRKGLPYDALVRQLLASRGTWTNHPAVNFVTATVDDGKADPIRLAGRTSRAFLGMRIDCLQCHDDFLGNSLLGDLEDPHDGTQRDFHQLAAYFSEVRLSLAGVTDQADAPYRVQYLQADEEQEVSPTPPYAAAVAEQAQGTRREQLAAWVTHPENRPFARAAVNRIWGVLLGRPLVEPMDDIPLHAPVHPALDILAEDFAASGFDLQRLIRLILATDVFQLESQADFEITTAHEEEWAVFPLTRLRPEQVAGILLQACSLKTIDARSPLLVQLARFADGAEFVRRFGDMGEDEFVDRGGTIPQRLLLMNGKAIHERTRDELLTNATSQIARFADDDRSAVEAAYLAVLTRRPSEEEYAHFSARLAGQRGNGRQAALEDLYWVLLNSSECSWNH